MFLLYCFFGVVFLCGFVCVSFFWLVVCVGVCCGPGRVCFAWLVWVCGCWVGGLFWVDLLFVGWGLCVCCCGCWLMVLFVWFVLGWCVWVCFLVFVALVVCVGCLGSVFVVCLWFGVVCWFFCGCV